MRRRTATLVLLAVLAALPWPPAVRGGVVVDVDLRPYVEGAGRGSVVVRAYQERRRPTSADVPLAGTSVVLLPRSAALLQRLEAIKTGARASMAAFRSAAPSIHAEQESFVLALREAGAPTAVRVGELDARGELSLADVPAGDWVLLASLSSMVDVHSTKRGQRDERTFDLGPRLKGYDHVLIWLREIPVTAGGRDVVELTDRNAWFSGVREVLRRDGSP